MKYSLLEIRQYDDYFYIAYSGELNKTLKSILLAGRQIRTYNNIAHANDDLKRIMDIVSHNKGEC